MNKPAGINPNPTVRQNTTEKRRLRFKFVFAAVIGLILVTSLTGCVPKAPHEHWVAALKKVNDLDFQEFVTTLSMNIQSDNPEKQKIYQIFNQVDIEIITKLDKEDRRFIFDFNLLYKGVNCGNLTLYSDLEKITVRSVFLGPIVYCFEWKDLQPLVQDYLDLQFKITDYFPLLLETDEKTWEQVELAIYDFYTEYYQDKIAAGAKLVKLAVVENEQEKDITCRELVLNMDQDDFTPDEISRLLQSIFANPATHTLIKDKTTQFITIAKNNGDLATWPITEEQLIAFRDNIDHQIDLFLNRMAVAITPGTAATPTSITQMNGKMYIDQKGFWRSMLTKQIMHSTDPITGESTQFVMTMEQKLINPGQKPSFPDFLPWAAINIGQTSANEWEDLLKNISLNLFAQVMTNPLIQDIMQVITE